ncbi:hypothetical protein [Massilia sp.]|uniref:hypothetical protein n=1 Tax=Massilia sp. TaxID=1882437 RepID=UPI00289DEB78|nr:hypothetical protein [Massilia sp.]
MSQLTLATYLEKRGPVKALTRIEAEVFGVPYPLVKGWAHRHGAAEITQVMLEQLREKIGRAKSSTAEKAQRGLDGVEGLPVTPSAVAPATDEAARSAVYSIGRTSPIPGFVLRQAKRYHSRRSFAAQKSPQGAGKKVLASSGALPRQLN